MTTRWMLACILAYASTGCFRTVYRNLEPRGSSEHVTYGRQSSAWRSFFLYGWVPHEVVVHAGAECGGAANVREIRTRRSFNQALLASVATSSGVNVYSPWTGEVVCGDRQ